METADKLLEEITATAKRHNRIGLRLELQVNACWWLTVILAGAASIVGLLPFLHASGTVVSFLAAAGSASEWVRRGSLWREKSTINWHLSTTADGLRRRMMFELPHPPTPDQVALIAREYSAAKDKFGLENNALDKRRDSSRIAAHRDS